MPTDAGRGRRGAAGPLARGYRGMLTRLGDPERGAFVVEAVWLMPALILLLFAGIQYTVVVRRRRDLPGAAAAGAAAAAGMTASGGAGAPPPRPSWPGRPIPRCKAPRSPRRSARPR